MSIAAPLSAAARINGSDRCVARWRASAASVRTTSGRKRVSLQIRAYACTIGMPSWTRRSEDRRYDPIAGLAEDDPADRRRQQREQQHVLPAHPGEGIHVHRRRHRQDQRVERREQRDRSADLAERVGPSLAVSEAVRRAQVRERVRRRVGAAVAERDERDRANQRDRDDQGRRDRRGAAIARRPAGRSGATPSASLGPASGSAEIEAIGARGYPSSCGAVAVRVGEGVASIIQRVTSSSGGRALRPGSSLVRRGAIALVLVVAVGSTIVWATGRGADDDERPNIVLIVTDDQRWDTLSSMPAVERRLVQGGVTFRNAFTTTPSCCPARVSVLTGQYSHTTGVLDGSVDNAPGGAPAFDDGSSLATWLDDAGYRTGMVGKYLNDYGELSTGYVPRDGTSGSRWPIARRRSATTTTG